MMRRVLSAVFLLAAIGLAGCSSRSGGAVTFTSATGQRVSQSFRNAYITQTGPGQFEVLLVDSASDWDYRLPRARRDEPIDPVALAPVRQAMRIHMFWRPLKMVSQNPAAINSSVDWYVLGEDASNEMLVYEGAAYATLDGSGRGRTVRIRDGQIRPATARGQLHDPVGQARITGRIRATVNDARVRETLAELQQQADAGRQ
jgi:hypothetical protein